MAHASATAEFRQLNIVKEGTIHFKENDKIAQVTYYLEIGIKP